MRPKPFKLHSKQLLKQVPAVLDYRKPVNAVLTVVAVVDDDDAYFAPYTVPTLTASESARPDLSIALFPISKVPLVLELFAFCVRRFLTSSPLRRHFRRLSAAHTSVPGGLFPHLAVQYLQHPPLPDCFPRSTAASAANTTSLHHVGRWFTSAALFITAHPSHNVYVWRP